jgi:hypothetical protein
VSGRTWQVELELTDMAPRKISCGDELTLGSTWLATEPRQISNWR